MSGTAIQSSVDDVDDDIGGVGGGEVYGDGVDLEDQRGESKTNGGNESAKH